MSDDLVLRTSGLELDQAQTDAAFQEGYLALAVLEDGKVIPIEALDRMAGSISTLSRNSPWWLGDLLAYAAEHYGDDWHQLVDNVGHTTGEIMDRVEVAETFAPKDRLIAGDDSPGLTWAQHRMFLKPFAEKGTRTKTKKLMKKAADSGWSDDEIRESVRELTAIEVTATEEGSEGEAKSTVFHVAIRVPAADGPAAMKLLEGVEKAAADPLINAGIQVDEVRHRISGVVPPSEPKRRGRPPKAKPEPEETVVEPEGSEE